MIELYVDGKLAYSNRQDRFRLVGLKTTSGLNKGGTAEIVMPPGHPFYNSFVSYRSVVELYENGKRRFRGRALYPSDDFYNCRTVMCEGERCFFNDGIIRPYLYQDTPKNIFADALEQYNSSVEEFKRFTLGEVTVTDPNDYVRFESTDAEKFGAFVDKLVERCGGYITFSDNENGGRQVNWLENVGRKNNQPIEFGENLLNFERSGQSPELATALIPYGAQLEDGTRVTIKSVNDRKDYIQDDDAVALRGTITATEKWDDVTDPANLLTKARQWLNEHKNAITALQLSAADLSRIDRTLDSFQEGDLIPVISRPHSVDDEFQLTDQTIDWLNADGGSITLGKTQASLTGADVIYERKANQDRERIKNDAVVLASAKNAEQLKRMEEYVHSEIVQLAGSISMTVNGGLGKKANITLTVDGSVASAQELDLSAVRQAFANDTTAVTISAGTITFNSGTIIINSENFSVTADGIVTAKAGTIGGWTLMHHKLYAGDGVDIKTVAIQAPQESTLYVFAAGGTSHDSYADCPFRVTKHGKLYATDAVVYGEIITIDGSYKTELDNGSLKLYYSDELCGTINTKYWSGASTEGISLRIEEGGKYIMFSHPSNAGTGYDVDYYLNYGWSSSYDEKHIFQTSARFLDDVYLQRAYHRALYLVNGDGTYLVSVNSNGTGLTVSKV